MTVNIVRWADLVPEPWRNGGGVTRQVAAGAGWRVSIADISADGPFSAFPGTDRVITLLDGPAPVLTVDDHATTPAMLRPFAFDGAATTSARRSGATEPSRDLNLMTERDTCTGSIEIRACGPVQAGGIVIAVVVRGGASMTGSELLPYDAVVLTEAADLSGHGDLAIIRILEKGSRSAPQCGLAGPHP